MDKADDFAIQIVGRNRKQKSYVSAFCLLAFFILLIYANSFDCSWHYDDYGNIVANAAIQITDLSWQNIEESFYGIIGSKRWQRPLSYFSFALNYYVGGLDVFGYHLVNVSIHGLTAFSLFIFIFHTLNLPILSAKYGKNAYSIALLSALLWAINPVQVTAVTYIVQRMASMVALFYIMAMFFYLKGRTAKNRWLKGLFFTFTILSGILAAGTKENAALLPISIFLYDAFLIRGIHWGTIKKSLPYGAFAVIAVIVIGFFYIGDISNISSDYQIRPFSMLERLLTQPRVLVFYISLLLYPTSSRLMLMHDVQVSTSLLNPWTTLPAILIIFLAIAVALWAAKKWPLVAYCILFFFINHFIEGSFVALELIYEHRNYLPSMLFFLPISLLIIHGLHYFSQRRLVWITMVAAITLFMIVQGVTVYLQNNVYKDDLSLWTDNKNKAPNLHTVRQNLATTYFLAGRLPEAFLEAQEALKSHQSTMPSRKSRTHGLLGEYYFKKNNYNDALWQYRESIKLDSSYHVIYKRLAEIMLYEKRFSEAEAWIRKGLSVKPQSFTYHVLLARILLEKGYPDEAIKEAFVSLALNAQQWEPYAVLADAFKTKHDETRANHYRRIADVWKQKNLGLSGGALFMQVAS